ncbi:MAG TPA: YdcF family protein [Oscillatoriaceae cyanobacterium M33_DOE_052]|uniref:YdcF family protein n=1 Tax=Planktothricoides sp. SpSt-374 TaxID=2282167 RepID=A0A7C3ZUX4_9CYAN|nr:YdcF family protein [Oscillatoriaceae cyanobacterium M33_DOE_052]
MQQRNKHKQPGSKWPKLLIRIILIILPSLIFFLGGWLFFIDWAQLQSYANRPVDAILVLGGSIRREIYVAKIANPSPQIPIIISGGSPDPCIFLIFQREGTSMQQVWLEKCAKSTVDNFYFSLPILQQWGVKRLKVITSPTHLPRAKWIGQILAASHQIWIDMETVEESGIPGNRESWLKTLSGISHSLILATIGQFSSPHPCTNLMKLADVDIPDWRQRGFKCERQGNIN